MANPKYYVGVDGGATKTECVVADKNGRCIGTGFAGPAGYHNLGADAALSNISRCVRMACAEAGVSPAEVSVACLGLASMDSESDFDALRAGTRWVGRKVVLENDSTIALAAAFAGGPGIVAVSGTGSVVRGVGGSGEQLRMGGWGYLIGDEGSAFDIGRRAIMEVTKFSDGERRDPGLFPTIAKEFGIKTPSEIQRSIYGEGDPVRRIASLAVSVSRLASDGNQAASKILQEAGRQLADLVLAVAKRLEFGASHYKVSFMGGVFASPFVLTSFKKRIQTKDRRAEIVRPLLRPSFGALILALKTDGVELSPLLLANLRRADKYVSGRRQELRTAKRLTETGH